ncbi:MBL fold metallo-hydrolase [Nanoarchaeota archaeon]
MNYEGIDVKWKGHDCFRLEKDGIIIYFDPFQLIDSPNDASVIFITHDHFDHCSVEDVKKVINPNTVVIATADCQSKLSGLRFKELIPVQPNQSYNSGISFSTFPSYNVNKFRSPGNVFHPRDGNVGYVIILDNKRILHAGDSDNTDELRQQDNVDIAFVPVSGTYVMTAEEAAKCVNEMKPKLAIPMHYGAIVGTVDDANKFKDLVNIPVEILEKE